MAVILKAETPEMFVYTLAQYVQAKRNRVDELGVYKIIEVYLPNQLLKVSEMPEINRLQQIPLK